MIGACPCGRAGTFGAATYDACCGRYLEHPGTAAPDAETLMRSRYTAYALGRADHLVATWAPSQRPERLALDPRTTWLGLQVLDHVEDGDHAEVEFIARYRQGGPPADRVPAEQRLHERSAFIRRRGRWWYLAPVDRPGTTAAARSAAARSGRRDGSA